MKKYKYIDSYDLYYKYHINLKAWNIYNDSDFIVAIDKDNIFYLFINSISDSNLITKSDNLEDIEQFIMED